MELIGMSDYNELVYNNKFLGREMKAYDVLMGIMNYTNFLKMKLELWMFIPCDKEGNVLEEPKFYNLSTNEASNLPTDEYKSCVIEYKQYQEAKDRVIFEGQKKIEKDNSMYYKFQIEKIKDNNVLVMRMVLNEKETHWHRVIDFNKFNTIEDLTKLGLTITHQAIKKYNLT